MWDQNYRLQNIYEYWIVSVLILIYTYILYIIYIKIVNMNILTRSIYFIIITVNVYSFHYFTIN